MSLFSNVQLSQVFPDQKTFVDCIPKQDPAQIEAAYEQQRTKPDFELKAFVYQYFTLPKSPPSDYVSDPNVPTFEHINGLWDRLTRAADVPVPHDSRVALPYPYVVPGGRFQEIFYWDSYFTMLGLRESLREAGRTDLIRGMIQNFAYLIETVGFIPNGNRTYFLSRSQPPFFALMVQLLAEIDGPSVLIKYLPQLQKEYDFWMHKTTTTPSGKITYQRRASLLSGQTLNTYSDDLTTPRPEAYRQETELTPDAVARGIAPETLYRHIRAACESGWDFSSRWCADPHVLATIHTADIVPVDLNCLLFSLEKTLQQAYTLAGNQAQAVEFSYLADLRKTAILDHCWNDETSFFHDYDAKAYMKTPSMTLAGVFPLFMNLATPQQAQRVHDRLKANFLQAGGWVTTLEQTGQQWDWPNGWAPLQWVVYKGLLNYGYVETANEGRNRWLALNDKVFKATGKMTEKYNVVEAALTTGGGEYPN